MTDPFLLDQREVELTLQRLEEALAVWRAMHKEKGSQFSDSLEYELQGVESSIRNGIRDVKWSLEDLEETLRLLMQNNGQFAASEDVTNRRRFLESARRTLADVEFEISSPSVGAVISRQAQQQQQVGAETPADILQPEQQEQQEQQEQVSLLRADSDEQVVFSKSDIAPRQQPSQQQKPVDTMVSLDLDSVRDLVEPQRERSALKKTIRWLSKYRCWLLLLLLVLFFFFLVLMRSLSRAAKSDALVTTVSAATTTTECPLDDFNCI